MQHSVHKYNLQFTYMNTNFNNCRGVWCRCVPNLSKWLVFFRQKWKYNFVFTIKNMHLLLTLLSLFVCSFLKYRDACVLAEEGDGLGELIFAQKRVWMDLSAENLEWESK